MLLSFEMVVPSVDKVVEGEGADEQNQVKRKDSDTVQPNNTADSRDGALWLLEATYARES